MRTAYPNELYHYGVEGMKWGVRRYQNPDGTLTAAGRKRYQYSVRTKTGRRIDIIQDKDSRLVTFRSRISGSFRKEHNKSTNCTLFSDGKKIGELSLYRESPSSLNVEWIGVRGKYRGQGIATAVMSQVVRAAKDKGFKQLTLEVPGDSPDARHIYERLGFRETGKLSDDDVWGGLTKMRLKL